MEPSKLLSNQKPPSQNRIQFLRIGVLLIYCFCFALGNHLLGQDRIKKPVVLIKSNKGDASSRGAGVIFGMKGVTVYAITAKHVILGQKRIQVELYNSISVEGEVYMVHPKMDLAIIKFSMPPGTGEIPSFNLNTHKLNMREEVTLVGHPYGEYWTPITGNKVLEDKLKNDERRFSMTKVGVRPGLSGGPILNSKDELIGMVTEFSSNRLIGIKSNVIKEVFKDYKLSANLFCKNFKIKTLSLIVDPRVGDLVLVEPEPFMMGSSRGNNDEYPVHKVKLKRFYLSRNEITVAQFNLFVEETNYLTDAERKGSSECWADGGWKESKGVNWRNNSYGMLHRKTNYAHPVVHISWNDAMAFCAWLSQESGITFRLPSEAEWEYAAGNGNQNTMYSWGNDAPTINNGGNFADKRTCNQFNWSLEETWEFYDDGKVFTSSVGQYGANQLGFYDMSGNVIEWCQDTYTDNYNTAKKDGRSFLKDGVHDRVIRGGGWGSVRMHLRVANRNSKPQFYRNGMIGFRVVREYH